MNPHTPAAFTQRPDDDEADVADPKPYLTRAWHVDLDWIPWILAFVIWAQALYTASSTIFWTLQSIHPITYWDSWGIIKFLELGQPVTLRWLWRQHMEHRILLPRLISLIDYKFFRGCGYFDIAVIALMQIGSVLLMMSLSSDAIGRDEAKRPWRVLACGFIVSLACSPGQMENFYWAFQTGFVGMMFFSIFAFFCLKQSIESRFPLAWILVGTLAAMASALGLASGMVTVWIFGATCWAARVPRRVRLVIIVVFVAYTAAYLLDYKTPLPQTSPVETLLEHRPFIIQFFFAFMGNIVRSAEIADLILAAIVGSWGVALFVLAVLFTPFVGASSHSQPSLPSDKRTPLVQPASLALFCIATLVVGQGLLTALGRYRLGLPQALVSHYVTPVLFFWIAVLVLILRLILLDRPLPTRIVLAYCGLIVILVGVICVRGGDVGKGFARRVFALELAANALRVGTVDLGAFSQVFPAPEVVAAARPFLLQHRVSIFSDSRYALIGRNIHEVAKVSGQGSCLGYFDTASYAGVQGGAKVSGWAWSKREKKAPTRLLLADQADKIVGLASGGRDRSDVVALIPEIKDTGTGWQGYSKYGSAVSAYALINGGREACRLEGTFNITGGAPVSADPTGR